MHRSVVHEMEESYVRDFTRRSLACSSEVPSDVVTHFITVLYGMY